MRKTLPYLAAWFLAGVAAIAVASAGVSMVGDQVTDGGREALSAEQVRELAAGSDSTVSTTQPPVTTTTTIPVPTSTIERGDTSSDGAPAAGGDSTTSTIPPPSALPGSTRTYNLVGGTATLRFGPSGVTVVAAVPNAGFSVDVSTAHDDGARVEFENEDHRSRVDAWWAGGPEDEVREDD